MTFAPLWAAPLRQRRDVNGEKTAFNRFSRSAIWWRRSVGASCASRA